MIRQRLSWLCGIGWALLLLLLALSWPRFGSWTIDDSVKRIAAEQGSGFWAERISDGPVRSRLAHPEENLPLHPPFADREPGAQSLGFSPWTRALFNGIFAGGDPFWKLIPAVIAIITWMAFQAAGFPLAFLLLPLTFYGLVSWEHGLNWLLLWPAVWLTFGRPRPASRTMLFAAGMLLSAAAALRPESLLLLPVVPTYLFIRQFRPQAAAMALGIAGGMAVLWGGYALMGGESALVQLTLNLAGPDFSFGSWLAHRGEAIYTLLLRCDRDPWISGLILICFVAGALTIIRAEKNKSKILIGLGLLLLLGGTALFQYRLWESPIPVLTMMSANSLIVSLPWVMLVLAPPLRWRAALGFAAALTVNVLLFTPVWEGVHWGPRILLFVIPLLMIDLFRTNRARGFAFGALLAVTLIQTAGSATVVYARAREMSDRVVLAREKLGTPVICPTMSQCADLAPLWTDREFFTAVNPRELRRLLSEMRFAGLDTVWLHVGANDPLFNQTFPEAKPVVPVRVTFLQAKAFYTTQWRIYELALNRGDTLWSEVLEKGAGEWLADERPADALRFQREAVVLRSRSAERRHNLALILARLGQTDDARREAEIALEINPDLEESRRLLDLLAAVPDTAP